MRGKICRLYGCIIPVTSLKTLWSCISTEFGGCQNLFLLWTVEKFKSLKSQASIDSLGMQRPHGGWVCAIEACFSDGSRFGFWTWVWEYPRLQLQVPYATSCIWLLATPMANCSLIVECSIPQKLPRPTIQSVWETEMVLPDASYSCSQTPVTLLIWRSRSYCVFKVLDSQKVFALS